MAMIKEYLDYAELAQASYGDLVAGMFEKDNTQYFDELTRIDFYGEIKFSQTQSETFANRYEVKAVADPYLTGLDAVLFYDHGKNKYILSIRGTSSASDVFSDILLAQHGAAYDQLAALNSFYNQWLLDGIIPIGTKLDVTGHSLGGVLAQSFALAHPNEVGGVYSYNAPGIGGLSAQAYEALGLTSGNIANANITNIYVKEGIEVTSGLGTMIGSVVPISIDNVDPLSNHRIPYTTESLHIYNMLSSITNTQNLNLLTSILEHTSNEKALSIVSDVFQSEVSGSVVDKAIELTKKWSGDATGLTSLVDKTASQLQSKRVENIYALLNLNPFVIEGDYLPAYTDINPDDYSDVFLANRADYLYYTLDKHNRYDVVRGLQDYKDISLGEEYNLSKGANVGKVLFGGDIDNTSSQMQGSSEGDYLFGMAGDDTLVGNTGNDYLEGGKGFDTLQGGADYDTYITDNGDTVMDSDGKGIVYFQEEHLSGGTIQAGASCAQTEFYYGDGGVYSYDKLSKKLTFTKNGTNETLSIENFTNTQLGITLSGAPACPTTTGDCPKPINPIFNFNFSLPTPSQSVTYGTSSGGSYSYSGGGTSYTPSTPHTYTPAPTPVIECVNSPVYHSTGVGGGGSSTGPIVLDLNRDTITSISIAASQALFDYDSDGVKENTAWIQSSDALLVNDKNADGIINNATELFGNYTKNSDGTIAKSGYQALSYYDSNSDNVIDATDTRFNELSLWIDSNQDGVTDTGELKTLSERGVTSLTLNTTTPYTQTTEETNSIIEETTFTDANGAGIMRDVLFSYENTSNPTDGIYFDMDANGIKEKMTTWTDPNQWMVVKDINNDGEITSGKEVIGNHMTLPNGTKAADTIQALKTFDTNHDGKIDTTDNSGLAFWTDRNHNGVTDIGELEALGAAGAIQTINLNPYQTLLSGYDNNKDGVINGNDALSNYLYIQTNADDSVTLYLPDNAQAKEMIAGYTGGESIQTPQGEKIIKTILFYEGYGMTLNDTLEGTDGSETLEGSSRSETLRVKGGRDIIDAGAGDDVIEGGTQSDKLLGGEGNDNYIYNRGDGKDLIVDSAGTDTITFAQGISKDDLIIKTNGADISIYLKDGSKKPQSIFTYKELVA